MGKEQTAVCTGGLVVEVKDAVRLKLDLRPSRIEETDVGRNCERFFFLGGGAEGGGGAAGLAVYHNDKDLGTNFA